MRTSRSQKRREAKAKQPRDLNILASIRGEIKMNQTCTTPNKRAYRRTVKHKVQY